MKIMVTGASGFLGTALCARLRSDGHTVTGFSSAECDLTRPVSLERFDSTVYDQVYHLAAWTQAGDFCLRHPGEQWIRNQQLNTNVLEWWHRSQPQAKLICMGTSCAYEPGSRLDESNYLQGTPTESLYTYAMTKRMLYVGLQALNKQFGLDYLCVVPSTLYGPNYHTDGRQMHFIFDLIRKIIRGKEFGEPVVLWGDGNQKRELVYVSDFVDILIRLSGSVKNEIVNVGAGEEYSIRHFANLVCHIVGLPPAKVEYDSTRYAGAASKCLSVEKLKALLGEYRLTDLREGIAKAIAWFYEADAYY
ncbi:MAG: NAD-dependent epimerase/dehydratase family protein [Bryobacteraceae bacterium]